MDCSLTGSECEIIKNTIEYDSYPTGGFVGYRAEWKGESAAVCIPDESCLDVDVLHCGKDAAYSFKCIQIRGQTVPMVWGINTSRLDVCVEPEGDTDVYLLTDTEPCADGEEKCVSDRGFLSCNGGYWTGGETCYPTIVDGQWVSYYRCFEQEPGADGLRHAVCAGGTGPCMEGDRKCVKEGGTDVLKCEGDMWVYSSLDCNDGTVCQNRDDGIVDCVSDLTE